MSTGTIHLNGGPPRPVVHGSGRIWPAMIVGFLALNASIVAVTVYFATSDRSVATEPDYYRKALGYNDTLRQRATNERLGWHLSPTLGPAPDGKSMQLTAALTDRAGQPIADARIDAVAFASVRSGTRQSLTLHTTGDGSYAAPITIDRPGQWCIRFTAAHDGETFASETTLLVPETATPAPGTR